MPYKVSNFALLKELLKTVPEDDSCMEWPRGKGRHGYGLAVAEGFRTCLVHRIAYQITFGMVADDFSVLQRCGNRSCFRPSHLAGEIGATSLLKELLKSIPEDDSCMEWPRSKPHGYGRIKFAGESRAIHRMAYELSVGPIPEDLFVLHKCDNPGCFRPSHLFLGTKLDNSADCRSKGRDRKCHGEKVNTAKLTEAEVRKIRQLRAEGWSERSLAIAFEVVHSNIHRIVTRRGWKHLTD